MATRFKTGSRTNYGIESLPSGYSEGGGVSEFVIPSVGIEDVDVGIFNLFDKEIGFSVAGEDGAELKKVPIVFAGGEKWALLKKNRPMRDKNGALILPIITIGRQNIAQSPNDDIIGRGINQRTGEITIRRKLDKSDRGYQNLINRIYLKHQSGLAVPSTEGDTGQLTTLRAIGDLSDDGIIDDGGFLLGNRKNNVYETIVIPSPQFFTANYEITIWTQFTTHMNQILETLLSSFLPQTQGWKIESTKGYWFVATVTDDIFSSDTNFEDMSDAERFMKYKINIKVPAYLLASKSPGVPIAVKRYISAPDVTFSTGLPLAEETDGSGLDDPTLGSDDPTLPLNDSQTKRVDQRRSGHGRLFVASDEIDPNDPALLALPRSRAPSRFKRIVTRNSNGTLVTRLVRISSVNSNTGETVYTPGTDLGDMSIVVIED